MIALMGGKSWCRSICGEAVHSNIMTEDGVPQSRGGRAALLAGGGNEDRYLDIVSSSTPPIERRVGPRTSWKPQEVGVESQSFEGCV